DDMRGAAGQPTGSGQRGAGDQGAPRREADSQQELARELDKVADKLASAGGAKDSETRKTAEQLGRVQQLRDRMSAIGRDLERLGQQSATAGNQPSPQKTPGERGRSGQGQSGGGAPGGSDLARLRDEYAQ